MDTLIPINVMVGDRTYRIKIEPRDEETVRKTVKVINDKVLEFKTQFSGKDMQDYIAMVVLWYATQQKEKENQPFIQTVLQERFDDIESIIDRSLEQEAG